MTDQLEARVIEIVRDTLRTDDPDVHVGSDDSMDTIAGWDSLQFMSVFMAINDAFSLDPDFDDAIHYTAIPSLVAYVREQAA
ncbi:MAG: acyl carrier protein [Actinomycetota bacterium]